MDRTAQKMLRSACFIMWIFVVVTFEMVPDAVQSCEQIPYMDPLWAFLVPFINHSRHSKLFKNVGGKNQTKAAYSKIMVGCSTVVHVVPTAQISPSRSAYCGLLQPPWIPQ